MGGSFITDAANLFSYAYGDNETNPRWDPEKQMNKTHNASPQEKSMNATRSRFLCGHVEVDLRTNKMNFYTKPAKYYPAIPYAHHSFYADEFIQNDIDFTGLTVDECNKMCWLLNFTRGPLKNVFSQNKEDKIEEWNE